MPGLLTWPPKMFGLQKEYDCLIGYKWEDYDIWLQTNCTFSSFLLIPTIFTRTTFYINISFYRSAFLANQTRHFIWKLFTLLPHNINMFFSYTYAWNLCTILLCTLRKFKYFPQHANINSSQCIMTFFNKNYSQLSIYHCCTAAL